MDRSRPKRKQRVRWSEKDLDALVEEALVDSYGEHEQRSSFYTLIDEYLALPFEAAIMGIPVTVTAIDLPGDASIVAVCKRKRFTQEIPLLSLPCPSPMPKGWEWVEAYRHWSRWQG